MKQVALALVVTVPDDVAVSTVTEAVNAALNEPPCDWGSWTVGEAVCTGTDTLPNEEDA